MEYVKQNDFAYFFSGISQDIIILILTTILFVLLGDGIYEAELGNDTNSSLVEFDTFVLIFLFFSIIFGSVIFYFMFTKLGHLGIRIIYSSVIGLPYLILIFELAELLPNNDFIFDSVSLRFLHLYIIYSLILAIIVFGTRFLYIYSNGILAVKTRNFGIYLSSAIIGRIMAIYFDLVGIVVFAVLLSVFDIFSVFRGPLAKIMGKPMKIQNNGNNILPPRKVMDNQFKTICTEGTPVVLSYQNTLLGIGDVLFFSILLYKALVIWGWLGLMVTIVMIIIGSSTTLYFLRRISPLPALPFPVLFSLIGYGFLTLIV